ncbi:histone acetyltransferases subunit 3-domain-containing protein [Infundibulicybe gibba]|nr:histone acetyltransferases subunit 3-domain-containing protein [Infundibulicybe gibba]
MSSKLSPYSQPSPIRSYLLKNAPDYVPPTEELDALHAELKLLKQRTLERAKKAGDDLVAIGESMRRMKEKEKGKAKAVEKVKRERDFTPLLDADEPRQLNTLHGHSSRPRLNSHTTTSIPPSARSSLDPRRSAADEFKKKKNKRKRENDDTLQRPRKTTPPVHHIPPHPLPAKSQNAPPIHLYAYPLTQPTQNLPGPDFSVPPPHQLLPPRPPPSKPTEVQEDFSRSRAPAQIQVTSFYTSIEPWIRGIKEEDVDEVEPYVMPKLGRHYSEVWEDQDAGIYPPIILTDPPEASPSTFAAPVPKWDPSTLMEQDLLAEDKGHGPLTERVISALLPMPDITVWKGVKAAEDAMEGRPEMNVSDLETRIRDTMRSHGLLNESGRPHRYRLRHAQRELRNVVAINKARRERLSAIARDRLGYQEYIELRDSIDKNISNAFSKLQKKDAPKLGKKKKKSANGTSSVQPPCPAALGLGPDDNNMLVVSEQLRQLVETRRQWVDTVGRIWGLPKDSVYQGVEDEVRTSIIPPPNPDQTNKGKEKARGDEMDVG